MTTEYRNPLDPWQLIVCEKDTCVMYDEDEKTGELDCIGEFPNNISQ